jgi:hypothetical protein
MSAEDDLAGAVALIAPLLSGAGGLGQRIAALENDLAGKDRDSIATVVLSHGLGPRPWRRRCWFVKSLAS